MLWTNSEALEGYLYLLASCLRDSSPRLSGIIFVGTSVGICIVFELGTKRCLSPYYVLLGPSATGHVSKYE